MYHMRWKSISKFEQEGKIDSMIPLYAEGEEDDEIERYVSNRYLIGGRGRQGFSLKDQEKIDSALDFSLNILAAAINAIKTEDISYLVKILSLHINIKRPEEIVRLLPEILRKLEILNVEIGTYRRGMTRQNQFAKIRDRFPSESGSAFALVFENSDIKHRRIFITNRLFSLSVASLATTIIHESSHHFLRTRDYWYNNYVSYEKENPELGFFDIFEMIAFQELSFVRTSDTDRVTVWSELRKRAADDEFLRGLRIKDHFKRKQKNKTLMNNADSVVAVVLSLAHKSLEHDENARILFSELPSEALYTDLGEGPGRGQESVSPTATVGSAHRTG